MAQLTRGRPGIRAARPRGRPSGIWGGSVLGAGNAQWASPLGTHQGPSKLTLPLQCQLDGAGEQRSGRCVSGCRHVEGASCQPHMVALSTSAASVFSPWFCGPGGAQWRKYGGQGGAELLCARVWLRGRCCGFGSSPLWGAQQPPALRTPSGLIFTGLLPLAQTRLREVRSPAPGRTASERHVIGKGGMSRCR